MSSSPSGTVTFLLADVEGSSALQSDERVDYPVVIGRIRSILRQAVDANAGHEVDAVGDELLAAFSDASRAVTAAFDAQRAMRDADWPEFLRARIRIGLHTGTPSIGPIRCRLYGVLDLGSRDFFQTKSRAPHGAPHVPK